MNLDETQKQQVAKWIEDGLKPAEIQKRLETEFNIRLTYMELRFLLDDLSLVPKDPPAPAPAPKPESSDPAAKPPGPDDEADALGSVSVTVDTVARPGAMVSGKVKFSDGESAEWQVDQLGRLGLIPKKPGYKPSQLDLQEFQIALQMELQKQGF